MRRGWRIALFHTAPLAGAYLLWWSTAPTAPTNSAYVARTPGQVVRFVLIGVQAGFDALVARWCGVLLGALVIGGLILFYKQYGAATVRRRAAAPLALALGAVVFLVVTGVLRSGQGGGAFRQLVGAEHARQSRYVYLVAAMLLPAIALASDAIIRRRRYAAGFVAVLLLAGLPGNLHRFSTYTNGPISATNKLVILTAPRLPLATELPRTLHVSFYGGGPTLGWLIDASRAGKLPAPPRSTTDAKATEAARLALRPVKTARLRHCTTIDRKVSRVLQRDDLLTVKAGTVEITYLAPDGGRSFPERFGRVTLRALAGPLKLVIAPSSRRGGPSVVCS